MCIRDSGSCVGFYLDIHSIKVVGKQYKGGLTATVHCNCCKQFGNKFCVVHNDALKIRLPIDMIAYRKVLRKAGLSCHTPRRTLATMFRLLVELWGKVPKAALPKIYVHFIWAFYPTKQIQNTEFGGYSVDFTEYDIEQLPPILAAAYRILGLRVTW